MPLSRRRTSTRTCLARLIEATALAALALSALAVRAEGGFNDAELSRFVDRMVAEHRFDEAQLRALFAAARRSDEVLAKVSRPAEAKPWHQYRSIFLTEERIRGGVEFWERHAEALSQASERYGVPAEVMIAILGVETFYGRLTGGHRVIDALATLAFDYPKRAPFFRGELESFLLLTRDQGVDPLSLSGSYAGAMGVPQFMPSSYLAYAVDFDGDGRTDIWSTPDDAIGSVGNYLARHGWEPGAPVVAPASVIDGRYQDLLKKGLEPSATVAALARYGVAPGAGLGPDTRVALVELAASPERNEYWLGLQNFYAITRYNRSPLYAMAVHQLAEAIRAGRGAALAGAVQ